MSEDSVTLGKRKERNVDEDRPVGSTLFVSNLPYSITSTDLKTLFSDYAPVRSAFVVLENNVSKGVGYVSFAIKEDAATTLETIENDGLELNGRKLRVQMADRKSKDGSDKKVKSERHTPVVAHAHAPRTKLEKDPDAIRTIVISGLPSSIDKKTLWKKVRKLEGAENVELVEESGIAHARFSTPSNASHAVEKLHAHVFKGIILSVTLKKRLENLTKTTLKLENNDKSVTPSRASRLIVRNVPWNISENDLRSLFLPFGPVYSIDIPMDKTTNCEDSKSESTKTRAKGFAFVWFFSKKDAEHAIAGVNGRAVEAGSIVAPTMNKKERQRLRRELRKKKSEAGDRETAEGGDKSDVDDQREDDVDKGIETHGSARILAVDWALSKSKWEEAKAKVLSDQSKETADDNEGLDSELSDEDEISGETADSDEGGNEDDEDERSEAEVAIKPILPQTDVGTTIFVRNVPFDATEDELRILFRAFGPLRYARITMDSDTGRSRGTGFVCFWNKEDADKAIHQSELLSRETGTASPKKNPFSLPSLLTPDPSSSLAQSLVLHGRTLDVSRAVTRDAAVRLKDEGERQREKADKRNLYLLREGVIFPGTPAEATLGPGEIEKRTASYNARRALLKSNPSLYVSKTRLSIRQLPLFVSERALKRLGIHAMRAFEEEVKQGERQPLSADELRAEEDIHAQNEGSEICTENKVNRRKAKKGERDTGIKQAKVVRQSDRVDALTGKGRSRGYGFLETNEHSDALRVLRWANNNPLVGPLMEGWWKSEVEDLIKTLERSMPKDDDERENVEARVRRLKNELEQLKSGERRKGRKTLIVEFSIENAQVVNRRKDKMEGEKSATKRTRSAPDNELDEDHNSADMRPSKRQKVEKRSGSTRTSNAEGEKTTGKDARPKNAIRSIIGRKRKMRKTKAKA
ncbi:RNA-binding domain-containing protein [Fomitiporia mediterranea MF3/22]|uniref:RNA-binding domain-containing protein n=1 Tax=Fomitiporia mediterranea (strain MF3/22) TaxID=694068 RepID=UPI0004407887|nr:RNA-binding domain-containing protein [Fomitiporia mediterranea MF3/22]EJD07847.1 RNA-binding domain-containing protein [Fomitiporia mediterranea MF3/22]